MKDTDELLRRHRLTPGRQLNSMFTNNVIDAIEQGHQPSRIRRYVQELLMKTHRLPKFAVIALVIAAAGLSTTGVYAAASWLLPKITILGINQNNDDNKREFIMDIKNCGVVVGGQAADNGNQRFEIAKDANLSDDQVKKVINDSCQFQKFIEHGENPWHDNSSNGAGAINIMNDPPMGKITAINDKTVTITSTIYQDVDPFKSFSLPGEPIPEQNAHYYPQGKPLVRTMALAATADVMQDGTLVSRDQLKVGDTVFFLSAAKPQPAEGSYDPTVYGDKNGLPSTVVHLIKTDIDPAYVQYPSLGNPSIINAISRLGGCQGNGQYFCLTPDSFGEGHRHDFLYASATEEMHAKDMEMFKDNKKYARTDIDLSKDASKYFHHVEGRISKLTHNGFELRSRGKQDTFKVILPYDAISEFNKRQDDKHKLVVGDYATIDYLQNPDENHLVVKSGDLTGAAVLLRQISDGSYVKY